MNHIKRLPTIPSASIDPCRVFSTLPVEEFKRRGFIIIPELIDSDFVSRLNARLERVLRGEFDTGIKPDKVPRRIKERNKGILGYSGSQIERTLQIINIWKSDTTFAELVLSPTLGKIVATIGGWKYGARVAQDQVWAKPPGASPLVFHRDSPYFDFSPDDVITVWIALDDMTQTPSVGPLEYCVGSHMWGDKRIGSANQFFQQERRRLMDSAATLEGLDPSELEIVKVQVKEGGCSIHNGRTWHGRGKQYSKSTQKLVAKMARRSGLSNDQMRFLRSQLSGSSQPLSSSQQRSRSRKHSKNKALTMRSVKRPVRKTQAQIKQEMKLQFEPVRNQARQLDKQRVAEAERRASQKWRMQNSHLNPTLAEKINPHNVLKSFEENKTRQPSLSPRVKSAASNASPRFRKKQNNRQEAEKMFDTIAKEVEDRKNHLLQMRALGQTNIHIERRIQNEISERTNELKKLDKLIASNAFQ
eukprot:g3711.t1